MKTIFEFINTGKLQINDDKTLGEFFLWLYNCDDLEYVNEVAVLTSELQTEPKFNSHKQFYNFIKENSNCPITNVRLYDKSYYWCIFTFECENISFSTDITKDGWEEEPFIENIKMEKRI